MKNLYASKGGKIFLLSLIIIVILIASVIFTRNKTNKTDEPAENKSQTSEINKNKLSLEELLKQTENEARETFNKNKDIKDLKFVLNAPSKIFNNKVIVQGEDNLKYLKHNERGVEDISGATFLDYRNNGLKDPNTIIYGHNMNYSIDRNREKGLSIIAEIFENNNGRIPYEIITDYFREFIVFDGTDTRYFYIEFSFTAKLEENETEDAFYPHPLEDYLRLDLNANSVRGIRKSILTKVGEDPDITINDATKVSPSLTYDGKYITFQTCPYIYDSGIRFVSIAKEISRDEMLVRLKDIEDSKAYRAKRNTDKNIFTLDKFEEIAKQKDAKGGQ